jgi:hypothetical protein
MMTAHGLPSSCRQATSAISSCRCAMAYSSYTVILRRSVVLGAIVCATCAAGACGSTSDSMPAATPSPSPTAPVGPFADISGMWSGTFESANFATRSITVTAVQTANCVDGAWVSSSGDWKGAISGFASADSFSGSISLERSASAGGSCTAFASASGPASQSALRLAASNLTPVGSCAGDLPTSVIVTLHR